MTTLSATWDPTPTDAELAERDDWLVVPRERAPGWTAYLDIETTTAAEVLWARLAEATAAGEVKSQADVVAWVEKHAADDALDAENGRVIVWAVAGSDGIDVVDDARDGDEAGLLLRLADALAGSGKVVAFNANDFDVPFVRMRALSYHREELDELARRLHQAKPWDGKVIDPLDPSWLPRGSSKKGWTLDKVARTLRIHRPETIPGKDVPAAWYAGRVDEIRAHCLDDVRTLREVTRRLAAGRG